MQILLKNAAPIEVEAVVRVVPQQREVVRGTWQGQLVYAKQFSGARAKKHLERDVAGVQQLLNASIPTPALLFQGDAVAPNSYVAIYAAITPAQNAEEAYAQLPKDQRLLLMRQLVQALALHHKAGLIQTDLYFKNFLLETDQTTGASSLYTLDGDGIRPISTFFKNHQQRKNLATLFSKMDVLDEDDWLQYLYQYYCDAMGMSFSVEGMTNLWLITQKIRQTVASDYADKKVFRTCTDVKVTQNFRYFSAIASAFSEDETTLLNLDIFLANAAGNIKNGNTCTIAKALIANRQVVVKRYNIKSLLHGFGRAFRKSRAAISWANAHRLNISNIATPTPLALVEERFGWLCQRAYFVSAFLDAPDVAQYFAEKHSIETKQAVAYEVASLFYRLSLLKISHGDCKASNLKIKVGKPVLLDLDAMQADPWFFQQKHIKDLKRFMRNWQQDAETTLLFKQAFRAAYHEADDPWVLPLLVRAGIASD